MIGPHDDEANLTYQFVLKLCSLNALLFAFLSILFVSCDWVRVFLCLLLFFLFLDPLNVVYLTPIARVGNDQTEEAVALLPHSGMFVLFFFKAVLKLIVL